MPEQNVEKWVSMQEICEHLGLKRETIIKLATTKGMPSHKVGKTWRFKISEVDKWIRSGKSHE